MKRLPWWKKPYFAHRVLEIGPGHNPFEGVTHVLERDVTDGRERGGNPLIVPTAAKLIVGEATVLPFAAASFDYVYASHVLEHVEDPASACAEIMRVAKAGYIETPSPFLEQGLALRDETSPEHWFHRWFVFSPSPGLLVFEPKSVEDVRGFCSCSDGQFLREFYESLDFRQAQHFFRRSSKTTVFYWNRSFQLEARDHLLDCRKEGKPCRFTGMRRALIANCNDVWRAGRVRRLARQFPQCRAVFRKYGRSALFIR
jgi:SAM-dependent methyltransferase